jgi:hypothetical protein
MPQRDVALPVVRRRVHDNALHRGRGAVALLARRVTAVAARNHHATAIRVQENLGRIESHPARRIARSLDAIAIDLARLKALHRHVPVVVRAVHGGIQAKHARRTVVIHAIEEEQLDGRGVSREDTEVDALPRRP